MRLNELPPEINITKTQPLNDSSIAVAKCSIGSLNFDIGYNKPDETVIWTNIANKTYDNIKDIFIENGKLKLSHLKDEPEITSPSALTMDALSKEFPELMGVQRMVSEEYGEMFSIVDGKVLIRFSFETKTGIIKTIEIDGTPYDDPVSINFDESHTLVVKVKEATENFGGPNFN